MALYIKFQNKRYNERSDYIRFKSGIKLFDTLGKDFLLTNLKTRLFVGVPVDTSYQLMNFDFGILETEFRNELKNLRGKSQFLGFLIEGSINIEQKSCKFFYELNPQELCLNKEFFDVRLEILPNSYCEIFEDLKNFEPDLKINLQNRIRQYNEEIASGEEYFVKRAILCKSGDQYENIKNWDYVYSVEPIFLLTRLIESSDELRDRLSYGNKQKFAHSILEDNNFAFLLSKYTQEFNVGVATGSISVIPTDEDSMEKFVTKLTSDLSEVARQVYNREEDVKKRIKEVLSKLV